MRKPNPYPRNRCSSVADTDWRKTMRRTLILSAAICALLVSAVLAFGDIARPKPSAAEPKIVYYSGLTVTTDSKAYEARLQISQDTWKRMQEAASRDGVSESMIQRTMHSSTR